MTQVIVPQAAARSWEPGLNLDNLDMPEPQKISVQDSLQLSINKIFSLPVLGDKKKKNPKKVAAPSLETFKAWWDGALNILV